MGTRLRPSIAKAMARLSARLRRGEPAYTEVTARRVGGRKRARRASAKNDGAAHLKVAPTSARQRPRVRGTRATRATSWDVGKVFRHRIESESIGTLVAPTLSSEH
jgi:hypothetical protein